MLSVLRLCCEAAAADSLTLALQQPFYTNIMGPRSAAPEPSTHFLQNSHNTTLRIVFVMDSVMGLFGLRLRTGSGTWDLDLTCQLIKSIDLY